MLCLVLRRFDDFVNLWNDIILRNAENDLLVAL